MNPDTQNNLPGALVLSDRIVFSKNIELQRGRHISCVYAGKCASGTAGSPFPAGWTSTKNGTGNYTITHNLNRTDYAVQVTFIDAAAKTGVAGGAVAVSAGANSFTIDIATASNNFDHDVYFTVLI